MSKEISYILEKFETSIELQSVYEYNKSHQDNPKYSKERFARDLETMALDLQWYEEKTEVTEKTIYDYIDEVIANEIERVNSLMAEEEYIRNNNIAGEAALEYLIQEGFTPEEVSILRIKNLVPRTSSDFIELLRNGLKSYIQRQESMKRLNEMINGTYKETLEQLDDILYGPDSENIQDAKLEELRTKSDEFHTEFDGNRKRR